MPRNCKTWTIREVIRLKELVALGMSAAKVHKSRAFPNRTESSIAGHMNYLGLGDPKIRKRILESRRVDSKTREALLHFLRTTGRKYLSSEVAALFGISEHMVNYYRRKEGLPSDKGGRFSSLHFKETHKVLSSKTNVGLKEYRADFWHRRREGLFKLFRYMIDQNFRGQLRLCRICGERWFATEEFFYKCPPRGRVDGVVRLQSRCLACGPDHGRHVKTPNQ